jgi:hypothetical protein
MSDDRSQFATVGFLIELRRLSIPPKHAHVVAEESDSAFANTA